METMGDVDSFLQYLFNAKRCYSCKHYMKKLINSNPEIVGPMYGESCNLNAGHYINGMMIRGCWHEKDWINIDKAR